MVLPSLEKQRRLLRHFLHEVWATLTPSECREVERFVRQKLAPAGDETELYVV